MLPSRDRTGFTLVELLVSLAITATVLVGVVAAVNAQQRAFYGGQKVRAAQNSARAALLYLEQKLPLAGFGMDPALALDLGTWYTTGPCPTQMGTCPRDSTSNADELVFYGRNPRYWVHPSDFSQPPAGKAWRFSEVDDSSVTLLNVREDEFFPAGQILQATCPGEARYAYFTVGENTRAPADGPLTVPLVDALASDPFRRQDVATGAPVGDRCFKPANAAAAIGRIFLVDRYRFHVRPVARGGGLFDPYLVLDRGVDANEDHVIDDKDEVLVAEGIELLQVGYVFADAANGIAGAQAGTAITFTAANDDQTSASADDVPHTIVRTKFPGAAPPGGETIYQPSSFYRYGYGDPIRSSPHQANIRAVRIALSARAPTPDPDGSATYRIASGFTLLNLDTPPAWIRSYADAQGGDDRFQRFRTESTVNLPNMLVRSITYF